MPMHLLLSGSGFFAVGRIVPRLQRIDAGVQVLQGKDAAATFSASLGVNPSTAGEKTVVKFTRKKSQRELNKIEEA